MEQVVDMEFSGVGLRAYDLALLLQMLLLKLLGEYWKFCSQQKRPCHNEQLGGQTSHLDGDGSGCGCEAGDLSDGELAEANIRRTLNCVLEGYTHGIGDCHALDVHEPLFVEQVCSLVACEMMWR